MPRTSNKNLPAVKGPLSLEELSPYKLGKYIATVEDVFHEPESIGRKSRCLQPSSYDYAFYNNYRVGWLHRDGKWPAYSHTQETSKVAARKNAFVRESQRSIAFMVKQLKVFPADVEDTCMYVFEAGTVYTHWRFHPESQWSAYVKPRGLLDTDWYFYGAHPGMELPLLRQLREGCVNLRDALYVHI